MSRTRYSVRIDELTESGYVTIELHNLDRDLHETGLAGRITTVGNIARQDNWFDTGNPTEVAMLAKLYPQWVLDNINRIREAIENDARN